jgi:hypothetical protein
MGKARRLHNDAPRGPPRLVAHTQITGLHDAPRYSRKGIVIMPGKEKTQTATNTSEPWSGQKPYIEQGLAEAKRIYGAQGPSYFPGSTVAGFSPEQQKAQQGIMNRASQGNAGMKAAEGFNTDTINGKYSEDPYSSQVFQNMQSKIMPSVNSNFSEAGRYGSGAHADQMTRALTESFAPYASQMYQQGQDRRMQAAGNAQGYAANDYQDLAAMQGVGDQKQQLAQGELDDARARYDYAQDLPGNKLGQYMGFIGGNYGGTTTSATPYYKPSPWSQGLGGLSTLAGIFG